MSLIGFRSQNHPQQDPRDDVDDRGTTPELFNPLHERFRFTLDVAAAAHNAKCARYFTRDDDGLSKPWAGERVWCNPPYSAIEPWVRKAWAEVQDECPLAVLLLPANRTEQTWWQELVEPYRDRFRSRMSVEFLPGRWRFIKAGATRVGPNERPPFGIAVVVLRYKPECPLGACTGCRYCEPLDGPPPSAQTTLDLEALPAAPEGQHP